VSDPATKADLDAAIADLKISVRRNRDLWRRWLIGWLIGLQLTYFVIMLFVAEHVR
jgi:hypothetical protein